MKKSALKYYLLLIFIVCNIIKIYPQTATDMYRGTADDGYSMLADNNIACPIPPVDETSYHGVADDGYSMLADNNIACPIPPVDETSYHGVADDGYSMLLFNNLACPVPPVDETSYHGLADDGYSMLLFSNLPCPIPPVDETSYHGLADDGYSMLLFVNLPCPIPPVDETSYHGVADDGYSRITTACLVIANLPIELLSFTVNWKDKEYSAAVLKWTTLTETNNDYFEVEKCTDAINFYPILKVKGVGNSNSVQHYTDYDYSPYKAGISYYRLKQTDFDGKFSYSQIEPLNFKSNIELINIFPNPAKNTIDYIIVTNEATRINIRVIDATGRTIINQQDYLTNHLNKRKLDISSLSNGVYVLQITTDNNQKTEKQYIVK